LKILLVSISLLSWVFTVNAQQSGRDQNRHGVSFCSGRNKYTFKEDNFESKDWRSFVSVGWRYKHFFNFKFGFVTGASAAITRTSYRQNPLSDLSQNNYQINYHTHGSGSTVVMQNEFEQIMQSGNSGWIKDHSLGNRIDNIVSLQVPTSVIFSSKFKGAFRWNTQAGFVHQINILRLGTTEQYKLWHKVVYNTEVKPRDKSVLRSSLELSTGFEWNYIGNRSFCCDFGYCVSMTSVTRKNPDKAHLMYWDDNNEAVFLSPKARNHIFSITLSTFF
jgi:hypothetical protein